MFLGPPNVARRILLRKLMQRQPRNIDKHS
jgi:hypothetical protein